MSAPCEREGGRADWGKGPGRRRSRVPQYCRLQGPRPSQTSELGTHALPSRPGKPGSGSVCPGKPLTARGQGCEERVQKQTLPAPLGAQLPGPCWAGRGRAVPRRQLAACAPGPVPVHWLSLVSPRSNRLLPGAEPLPAGLGQPGSPHTSTCAPPSARPAFKSAPPSRSLPRSCTEAQTLPG